jgi:GTP-binding protein Era
MLLKERKFLVRECKDIFCFFVLHKLINIFMTHKAGFVNIIGNPNVGKSTLMNALSGEKLSIITPKAQTTRHRIMGIVNGEDFQIVYSDTPGIVNPHYKLHQSMMHFVESALLDADVFLYVTEFGETGFDEQIVGRIREAGKPLLLLINKIDLASHEEVYQKIDFWHTAIPDAEILPVSALKRVNTDKLVEKLIGLLPESPPYFPKDELTDRPLRFFVSEIIREKIFLQFQKEVPYSCEVIVNEFKEEQPVVKIAASIYVARESQKAILLGHQGKAIKRLGTEARKDIESFIDSRVFLELTIKVSKDWRDDERQLRRFGYEF